MKDSHQPTDRELLHQQQDPTRPHNINNINHHYRYNHYPRRSSASYSSTNLSSYSPKLLYPQSSHNNSSRDDDKSSSSPTASTASASTSSSSADAAAPSDPSSSSSSLLSPPENKDDVGNTTTPSHNERSSMQAALSLYQAFAAISYSSTHHHDDINGSGSHNNCSDKQIIEYEYNANGATGMIEHENHTGDNDDQLLATSHNTSIDDDTLSSNYIGDINENEIERSNGSAITANNNDGLLGSNSICDDDAKSTEESNSTTQINSDDDDANSDDNDESTNSESTTSWTSYISTPTANNDNQPQQLPSTMNIINRHRKKIGTLLLSMASLWVYSQYNKKSKKQQWRRRHLRNNKSHHIGILHKRQGQKMKILGICQWLIQLLSPLRVSTYLKKIMLASLNSIKPPPQSTTTTFSALTSSRQPWNNAATTPLSHLLAMAKSGSISKVMLHGSALSYLHSMQSSSSTAAQPAPKSSSLKQRWSQTTLPSQNKNVLNEIISTLLKHGCDDITTLPESLWKRFLNGPVPVMVFPFAYLAALYWMMRRLQRQQFEQDGGDGGEGGSDSSWNRGAGKKTPQHQIATFEDVAGIDSSLQELSEVISYMRNPASFHDVGAHPPRGILLYGPPGSGKTLLARAIAGEAERCGVVDGTHHSTGGNTIDCFAVCSGSEFVETYVGRGAARVRSLFRNVREEALRNFKRRQRKQIKRWNTVSNNDGDTNNRVAREDRGVVTRAMSDVWGGVQSLVTSSRRSDSTLEEEGQQPMAIIFIDEIDALAKRRDSGMGLPSSLGGGGCDEREQTLNQLLTEMDGFATGGSSSEVNVIIIAATNRPEVLDPAIMRPGRFDRHVQVTLPDARGREAILRVHARRIRWDQSSVNFCELPTHNFSGADLKNVINEAALFAVRRGSPVVKQDHLLEAVQKIRAMHRGVLPRHQQYMR